MCDKVISKNLIRTPAIVSYVGVKSIRRIPESPLVKPLLSLDRHYLCYSVLLWAFLLWTVKTWTTTKHSHHVQMRMTPC